MEIFVGFIFIVLSAITINTVALKFLREKWNLWLGYAIPASLMMLLMWNFSAPKYIFSDFNKAYYEAGRLIIENPSNLYNQTGAEGFVNIPIVALIFTPFSLLSKLNAEILITVLGILSILATLYVLLQNANIDKYRKLTLFGIFIINGPLYYSLREGNTTHFVLLILLLAFTYLQNKREFLAGALLAIAAVIKLPLLLFGGYLLFRKRWNALTGFTATLLAIIGTSLLVFGTNMHIDWYEKCIKPYMGKPMSVYNVQSIDSFLIRLVVPAKLVDIGQPLEVGWQFKLVRYLLISLLLGATIWLCWRARQPETPEIENLELSIVICLAITTSPLSWTHYYLFLLLPLSWYICGNLAVLDRQINMIFMGVICFLISLPVNRIYVDNRIFRVLVSRLFVSRYVLGALILIAVLLVARASITKKSLLSSEIVLND